MVMVLSFHKHLQDWNNLQNQRSLVFLLFYFSSDLSELQLQVACDAQIKGGTQFPKQNISMSQHSQQQQQSNTALTGPARGLLGGDNP